MRARSRGKRGGRALLRSGAVQRPRPRRGFTGDALAALLDMLHRRGVKGFAALNTLVFADELDAAAGSIRALARAGVDALIVQDPGVCRLVRETAPGLPVHASTQMTVTSAAGVEFARALGASLVVLARECPAARRLRRRKGGRRRPRLG